MTRPPSDDPTPDTLPVALMLDRVMRDLNGRWKLPAGLTEEELLHAYEQETEPDES